MASGGLDLDHTWFPAGAGMDPRSAGGWGVIGFPARCGDEPRAGLGFLRSHLSPPAPGGPARSIVSICPFSASPARAGMDPPPLISFFGEKPWGLPRPRGDGPPRDLHRVTVVAVPPPARGWDAPLRCGIIGIDGVPPARAMDPCFVLPLTEEPWEVPPPARGWTPPCGLHGYHFKVFPTPRGDGPHNQPRHPGVVHGSPAPALGVRTDLSVPMASSIRPELVCIPRWYVMGPARSGPLA